MLIFLLSQIVFAQETDTSPESSEPEQSSSPTEEQKDENASEQEDKNENTIETSSEIKLDTKNATEQAPTQNTELDQAIQSADKKILLNTDAAESLDTSLSKEQLNWLKPTRSKLPQNPYQHVDFTAYTLEWGEFQFGLNRSGVGILPRTQIGTQVLLDAVGIYNVDAKINMLRLGDFDLAIEGNYLTLPSESLSINYYGMGAIASIRLMENWSIHAGGKYANLNIDGFPDLSGMNNLLVRFTGLSESDVSNISAAIQEGVNYQRQETILSTNLASDIRLNRRDSILLQGNIVYSQNDGQGLQANIENTDISIASEDISSPLFRFLLAPEQNQVSYSTSLAYQASFKRAYLRVGWGYSNIPYSWLLQSVDLTWRLGGKTKRQANKMQQIWELNKRSLKRGADKK